MHVIESHKILAASVKARVDSLDRQLQANKRQGAVSRVPALQARLREEKDLLEAVNERISLG